MNQNPYVEIQLVYEEQLKCTHHLYHSCTTCVNSSTNAFCVVSSSECLTRSHGLLVRIQTSHVNMTYTATCTVAY